MYIPTRIRAIVLSITITVVYFVFREIRLVELLNIDLEFDFFKLLLLSIIMYFGQLWVISFRVKGERFLTVALFPSLVTFILTFYVDLIIESVEGRVDRVFVELLSVFAIGLISYVLILTSNLLNISYLQKIPLGQAARAAHYVLTLISMYLFYSIVFSNSFLIIIKIFLTFVLTFVFTFIALWTIELEYKKRFISSVAIAITLSIFASVLAIWPIGSEYIALILSLIYYMILGLALEIREVLTGRIWLEYSFLFAVIVLILFLVSNWGINGRII